MFIPEGYVSVQVAIQEIADAHWRIFDRPTFGSSEEATEYYSGRYEKALTKLGSALASQKLQAIGIADKTGDLIFIPSGYWRTTASRQFINSAHYKFYIEDLDGHEFTDIMPIIPKVYLQKVFPEVGYEDASPPLIWPKEHPATGGNPPQARSEGELGSVASSKNRGGRPPKMDWESFWVEVASWVAINGNDEADRIICQQHMRGWTDQHMEPPPGESTIRSKLAKVFPAPVITEK
jgi:hypothetical protein